MKDIMILKKKKESLLSRIFGLKRKVEEEEIVRTHRVEIESLETEVRSVEDLIFDSMIEEAKTKIKELEIEAVKLAEEKSALEKRKEEIEERMIELFNLAFTIIPQKRRQTASRRTVVMQKEIEERTFSGYFARAVDAHDEGSIYTKTKKIVEIDVPVFPSQIESARSGGYELKEGEKVEFDEPLDNNNSIWVPLIPMPDVLLF